MYYVMSIVGFECYSPIWFKSELSKEEFEKACKVAAEKVILKAMDDPDTGYIDGHLIIGEWNPKHKKLLRYCMAELGFEMIEPTFEYSFIGECLYTKRDRKEKPDMFSDELWDKILKHNQKIRDGLYKDEPFYEQISKEETKEEKKEKKQ